MTDLNEKLLSAIEAVEKKLIDQSVKAEAETKANGKASMDTLAALETLGLKQLELADEILQIKQRGLPSHATLQAEESIGEQFVKSQGYGHFQQGNTNRVRLEVKNTVTNPIGNTFSDRGSFVGGAFRTLTLESLLTSLTTTSNAVDYVRENVFTNSAAETAEGAAKPESALTTTLVSEPVATIAHWIKISKQLASDNAALASYINTRMVYGVNLRVENQIIAGNGTAPNMSGLTKTGNFTAHGYTSAALGAVNQRLELIRRMIGDAWAADYPADTIILNPVDWAAIDLLKDSQNRYLVGDPASNTAPMLWGIPVVVSNAMTVDTVMVAALRQSSTFYNREGVTVELSDSDSDNFTKNLITVRAERRCMLAVERPAAIRFGDLTPA